MRRSWIVLLAVVSTSGCHTTISLPLGGLAPGRGQTLGQRHLHFSGSVGTFAEVAGSLPLITDSIGDEINPIPALDAGASRHGVFDILCASYGVTDWFDVGLSFSRGLHSFVRVVGNDRWAVTISPSIYHHSAEVGGGTCPYLACSIETRRGAVTNLSVATLASYSVPGAERRRFEVYGGATISRYSAWISTDAARVEGTRIVPSVIGGVRSLAFGRQLSPTDDRRRIGGVSLEGGWTYMRQRDGTDDIVPQLRLYLTIGGEAR